MANPETSAVERNRQSFLQKWKKIFLVSCLFAVLLDPLFLYIPMMKDDIKCLQSDRKMKIAALLFRSFTDLFYILDIIVQVYTSDKFASVYAPRRRIRSKITFWSKSLVAIAKTMSGSYIILIDILAILPLPQVAILIFFPKMRDLRSLNTIRMVIMNLFVLLQYVPRVLCIYLSCKEFKTNLKGDIREIPLWIKGALNFFLYILASHVIGAIWYFFAIQRVGICWHDACRKEKGCSASTFGCHDHHAFRNITFLNDLCPISPMNATLFDFGIYTKVLQSGIPGSTDYFQKLSNCFWLGLRHISSFGSNLEPSIDGWENLFVAFISIIGLLLFLYLIGNLQAYMQLDRARIEALRHNIKVEQKMEEKDKEMELWLSKYHIPKSLNDDIKSQMMNKVRHELEADRDADLGYVFSILPLDLQSQFKRCMPIVPMLRNMDERVLTEISGRLQLREFDDNSIIIAKGRPLDMMLFIVDGRVSTETRGDSSSSSNDNVQQRTRGAGEVCGEELLRWPLSFAYPQEEVFATESAKAIGHVEALVLTASDLRSVVEKDYFVGMMHRTFSAKELVKATDNYNQSRIIGKALGIATFYKGELRKLDDDKTVVAVKKYESMHSPVAEMTVEEAVAVEAAVASQTNHTNVVRFLGGCLEPETQALVFEYIPNGTLFEHIHKEKAADSFERSSSSPTALLSFELRLKIASETAGALAYLHSLNPPIIHQCLSTKNILLDYRYTAKLSAPGFSRTAIWRQVHEFLFQDYADPHFQRDRLAEKSDVYSFGVVLAELLTSQKPAVPNNQGEEPPLATCLLSSVEEGRLNQIWDAQIIVNEATSKTAKKVADLAKRCLRSERAERPSMEQVAAKLAEYQRGEPSFSNRPTSLLP